MALFLIRHGETELNASRVLQHPETPLGESGLTQAEHLGRYLSEHSVGLVVTSDYTRAHMTAERIAGHSGAPMIVSENLRERNFGAIRGMSYDDLEDFDLFDHNYVPPEGESWPSFNQRVDRAWEEVLVHAAEQTSNIAVVTHGLVLRSLVERVLDVSHLNLEDGFVVANTAVTTVEIDSPWRVVEFASVAHLPGEATNRAPV